MQPGPGDGNKADAPPSYASLANSTSTSPMAGDDGIIHFDAYGRPYEVRGGQAVYLDSDAPPPPASAGVGQRPLPLNVQQPQMVSAAPASTSSAASRGSVGPRANPGPPMSVSSGSGNSAAVSQNAQLAAAANIRAQQYQASLNQGGHNNNNSASRSPHDQSGGERNSAQSSPLQAGYGDNEYHGEANQQVRTANDSFELQRFRV